jgi:folate-binding protein YgfZ
MTSPSPTASPSAPAASEATPSPANAAALLEGIAALPHLGVIRAQGEEAAKFLQGQLTQDFMLIPEGHARFAGYCSPKGRLLASFVGVRLAADDFALVVSADILAPTLKRLSMFVLRAKVKLSDATAAFKLRGLAGEAARSALGVAAPAMPEPWTDQVQGEAHAVALYPADGVPRALWLAPAGTTPPEAATLSEAAWLWSEVRSGVATITAPVVEAFVPQMLNYESVGGVNFKKGCYPGQEVVARSQFRGQIKRRAFLVRSELPLTPGQEMQLPGDDQASTLVVQASPLPENGSGATFWDAIVSGHLSGEGIGALENVADGDATRLYSKSIPYFLLADI